VSEGQVVAATVTHQVHPVATERKRELLTHVLTQPAASQALVFCRTKHGSDKVGDHLERAGVKVAVIHGNKSQGARTRALRDFQTGRVAVLVATDIAARGLDIVQLPLVVNYDLPLVAEDYIHRVGRTARAEMTGDAFTFVSPAEEGDMTRIERALGKRLPRITVPDFDYKARPEGRLELSGRERRDESRAKRPQHGGRPSAGSGRGSSGGRRRREKAPSRSPSPAPRSPEAPKSPSGGSRPRRPARSRRKGRSW
jgi:ATP-dependent RNA helicase RhlE